MKNVRLKILYFASWYPNRYDKVLGLFIKNKAQAVSSLCDVAVIYAMKDPAAKNVFDIESSYEKAVFTVRVYFRTSRKAFYDALLYNFRFLHAYYLAWKIVKEHYGVPDLIHVNVVDRAGVPALFFKWLRHIPFVITDHSTPDVAYTKGERLKPLFPKRWLKRLIWRFSSGGSVDSTISLKFLEKIGISSKICVIPNVVNIDAAQLQRTKIPPQTDKKIGLHISILNARKNVHDIIQATAQVSTSRHDFEIHIIGEGEQKTSLIELAKNLNIFNRIVFFHGYVTDEQKLEFIARSDFHILNSDEEGFSVVTAESLCYGIPVITTDCGGPEDFVSSKNGIMVRRRDLKGLSAALEKMLETARSYDRVQISSEACARFDPSVVAQQTCEMYYMAKTMWPAGNTGRMVSIPPYAHVLDVGSGHQPNRRANVLLDKYPEGTIHRTTQQIALPQGKEFIVGDALAMPFPDKSFDFIIASHIAEHVDDPVQFCHELSRVGKGGYIETPGPLTEYLMPTASHKWIVTKRRNIIFFRKNTVNRSYVPFFFRFFYLNRDGYVENTWNTSSKILKNLNLILIKLWIHIPYAYTHIEWNGTVVGVIPSNR
jgi:glycosyltransferase involved in cell wall biosynthesis